MTIAVHERTLAPNDPLLSITSQPMTAIRISLEGVAEDMVYLAGVCFAWLEPTSPKQGVLAHVTDLGYTLIAYCADTRRTSVMAVELKLETDDSTYAEQLSWLTAGGSAAVDYLAVCPGALSINFDPVFSALRNVAAPLSIQLSFNTYAAPKQTHFLEVLRATPACTILYAPLGPQSAVAARLDVAAVLTKLNAVVAFTTSTESPPLWKRYNGQRGANRLPILSDEARSQLHAAREVHNQDGRRAGQIRAAKKYMQIRAKLLAMDFGGNVTECLLGYRDAQLALIVARGSYCPVCGSTGAVKLCGGCGAETYCSVEHQREDWPHHKGWCKKNRKSKEA